MAELAIVGVIANIVQLVDFGTKIIGRVREFQSAVGEAPQSLHDLTINFSVLIKTVDLIQRTAESYDVNTKLALEQLITKCLKDVKLLDELIRRLLPRENDSTLLMSQKALVSLAKDKYIKGMVTKLEKIAFNLYMLSSVSADYWGVNHIRQLQQSL